MPERVRLEYVEPDQGKLKVLSNDLKNPFMPDLDNDLKLFPEHTPVAPCVRCGAVAEDPIRRLDHERIVGSDLWPEEEKQAVCFGCQEKEEREQQETEVLELLESKLGLAERHRDALRSFIETVFTDPQKILRVQDLDNRVGELEKQNGRLWVALGITAGLVAISIAGVVGIALALAS